MRFKTVPPFSVMPIKELWDAKISNLESMSKFILGSVLISLDIESTATEVIEVGLAIVHVSSSTLPEIRSPDALREFYKRNNLQVYSVEVRANDSGRENVCYGSRVKVEAEEVVPTIAQILDTIGQKSNVILVGYDMVTEFRWLAEQASTLATRFTSWVDVQELVAERIGCHRAGLIDVMASMQVLDRAPGVGKPKYHRASRDAVRCLAVLSGLLQPDTIDIQMPEPAEKIIHFNRLPKPSPKHPYTARISTTDGSFLPSIYATPRSLIALSSHFDLRAVAMNRSGYMKNGGIRYWWVLVHTQESLQILVTSMHNSVIAGKTIIVQSSTIACADDVKDILTTRRVSNASP